MKKFLKIKEVADMCGCCTKTIHKYVDRGEVKVFRNRYNYRLIPFSEILKLQKILVGKAAPKGA